MMQQYGHQSVVTIDATFGTNENKVNCFIVTYITNPRKPLKHDVNNCNMLTHVESCLCSYQFPLYTLMVFDKWKNDCLVAYIITVQNKQKDQSKWMDAIN
jgi:hypothetical protein